MERVFSATHVIILGSVAVVSLFSFTGLAFFCVSGQTIQRLLFAFVSVSTGVLFGDVFLHMIPEMGQTRGEMLAVLGGILASFSIEKIIHWHHCHSLPSQSHYHPVGIMSLFGDALHNFIDGVVIAVSFLAGTKVGIATTVAVVLHEIPHEISNFALLLFSGFTRKSALLWNAFTAITAFLGAIVTITASGAIQHLNNLLLPFAAGNLLYIAGTDLLPELHKDTHVSHAILQLLLISAGIGVMLALLLAL